MANFFEFRCPNCGDEDQIDIQATVWLRVTKDGTDADASACGDHIWCPKSPAHCAACDHEGTVESFTPKPPSTATIKELNDQCRKAMGIAGKLVQTAGINALPLADQSAIREKVETFNDFTPDNDPHGERDFGAFEHNGNRIFWKIDYYDRTLSKGSEDPSDPSQTVRVLTIMLASEY